MKDHRKHRRIAVDRLVRIRLGSGEELTARMINLSAGGLGIRYPEPARKGAVLTVCFRMNLNGFPDQFESRALVRHNHLTRDGYIVGAEFMDLSEEQSQAIRRFVDYLALRRLLGELSPLTRR